MATVGTVTVHGLDNDVMSMPYQTAVARGDLTQKVIGLSVSGEYLHLVNTIW
jgi:hypothetical protein